MPEYKKREIPLRWGIDGTGEVGLKSPWKDEKMLVKNLRNKVALIHEEMQDYESIMVEDAEYVLVASGIPGRVCIDAVKQLRNQGEKVGVIRPKVLWPYPLNAFKEVNNNVKGFISVESNDLGQMVEDVALSVKKVFDKNIPIYSYPHSLGVPEVKDVIKKYKEVKNGNLKEVF